MVFRAVPPPAPALRRLDRIGHSCHILAAMTLVKICGLSTPETVDAALESGADLLGFVFFPASPRYVTPNRAAELRRRVAGRAEVVALAVDPADADLAEIVDRVAPDWLQLHGREPPARVAEVKARFGLRVMKAVGVRGRSDVADADPYLPVADRLLFDAKPPAGALLPGGNGIPFNWRLLRDLDPGLPFLLSGGLDPANVAGAIELTRPLGVDVSSGVETAPGRKDANLIRAFLASVRLADARDEMARARTGTES